MHGELRDDLGWAEFYVGKYKGMTVDQVAERDFGYLVWVADRHILSASVRGKIRDYLAREYNQERIRMLPEHRRPRSPGQYVLLFGKHRGFTLEHVERVDPGYIDWLGERWMPHGRPDTAFYHAVKAIVERRARERRRRPSVLATCTG